MKQSSVSVLFFLAVLLVVAYPSPAQDSVARTAPTSETRQVKVITSGGFTAAFNILGPMFAQATGIEVITEYGSSMGGGPESIAAASSRRPVLPAAPPGVCAGWSPRIVATCWK